MSSLQDFLGNMQPASFRGVPFAVLKGESRFGRRIALHEYPYRDKPWPEDLGKSSRKFSIQGFIITDSFVYGGGDVFDQRDQLVAAAETEDAGTLIHPTLGRLQVSIPEDGLIIQEALDAQTYMEFTLSCYEAGERTFPSTSADQGGDTLEAADELDAAAGADYASDVTDALSLGTQILRQAVSTATAWVGTLGGLANDATSVFNLAAELTGPFGRFFNGSLLGYVGSLLASPTVLTLEGLILDAANLRGAVAIAGRELIFAAGSQEPLGVPPAASAAAAALVAATVNPADGVRLLAALASFYPSRPTGTSVVGSGAATMQTAMGALLRRCALSALVRVAQTYQPQSEEDAATVRLQVCDLLDAEALVAGDSANDASYAALVGCRAAVATSLDARGAAFPPMRQFTFGTSLPALVIAQRLYQDAGRADQLVAEANPPHPAFMPPSFKALAT